MKAAGNVTQEAKDPPKAGSETWPYCPHGAGHEGCVRIGATGSSFMVSERC